MGNILRHDLFAVTDHGAKKYQALGREDWLAGYLKTQRGRSKQAMEPKLFYQQPAARVGDVIPKYLDGKYQLFYLKNWRDHNAPGFVPGWHRMETTDLVHMGPESPIGVVGGTAT